jgi:thrombospondin type 3 repeat protein
MYPQHRRDTLFKTALICSLFISLPGLAVAGTNSLPLTSEQPAIGSDSANGTSRRLFFSVPAGTGGATARELRLEIAVEGQLFVEDTLRVASDPSGQTFEFLAGDDARQRRLAAIAATSRPAEARVMLDGKVLRTFSLQELLTSSEAVRRAPLSLSYPTTELRTFGPAAGRAGGASRLSPQPLNDCPGNCQIDRQYCYQNTPECAYVDYCDVCETQYNQCLNYCAASNDSDGDGIRDGSDNCPYAANPDQADCDGDGAGDTCDTFNGHTEDRGTTAYLDFSFGPLYSECFGPVIVYVYLGHFTSYHLYDAIYCNGAVVHIAEVNTYYAFFGVAYYDPFACGYTGLTPQPSSTHSTTPQASAQLQKFWNDHKLSWSNGRLLMTGADGEHALTMPSSAELRVEQRGRDLLVIGPSGTSPLSLVPVEVRPEDLTKVHHSPPRQR